MKRKVKIQNIILVVFCFLWIYFWLRGFYRDFSRHFTQTKELFLKPLSEKWEYIFGADLYQLLLTSKKIIPPQEKINFVHNLDRFKSMMASYFLFPREFSKDSDFIMVYKQPFEKEENSRALYSSCPDVFIIKK